MTYAHPFDHMINNITTINDEINLGIMDIYLTTLSTTLSLINKGINRGVMVIHLTTKMIYSASPWITTDR